MKTRLLWIVLALSLSSSMARADSLAATSSAPPAAAMAEIESQQAAFWGGCFGNCEAVCDGVTQYPYVRSSDCCPTQCDGGAQWFPGWGPACWGEVAIIC
jgi:hypothetical protein